MQAFTHIGKRQLYYCLFINTYMRVLPVLVTCCARHLLRSSLAVLVTCCARHLLRSSLAVPVTCCTCHLLCLSLVYGYFLTGGDKNSTGQGVQFIAKFYRD